jgi:hypothetical protein
MIQTQATEPGLLDLFVCRGRSHSKDGIWIVGTRGIQAGEEEGCPGSDLLRGEPSTFRHLPRVFEQLRSLSPADLYEEGDELVPVRTDRRCIGNRIAVG